MYSVIKMLTLHFMLIQCTSCIYILVVMKIERDVFSGKFSIQNVVIPNQYLVIKMDIPVAELPRQGRPNAIIKRDIRFEGKVRSM